MLIHFEEFDLVQEKRSARITVGEWFVTFSSGDYIHQEHRESSDIKFIEAKRMLESALVLINQRITENGEKERL